MKLFEAFAGYGSQAMSLKRADKKFKHVGISEIDKYAIIAYDAVHGEGNPELLPHEEMKSWLLSRNIGVDYKTGKSTLKDREVEPLYVACQRIGNYGDISLINPALLPDMDLFTYSFPCFVAGTLVMTEDGYKNIEDIATGDRVITHNNRFKKVIKPMVNTADHLYNLSLMCSEDLQGTEEHPFYVREKYKEWDASTRRYIRKFKAPTWLSMKDLSKDYYIGISVNQESKLPNYDGCVDNRWGHGVLKDNLSECFSKEDFWWFVGRYIGDGWTQNFPDKHKYRTIICCAKNEALDIENNLETLGFSYSKTEERTALKYHICNKELSLYLDRFGKYDYGKRITNDIFNLPVHLLLSFINGYLSANGSTDGVGLNKITSVSKELSYGIGQCIAKAYNRPFSVCKTKRRPTCVIEGRIVNQKDSYQVTWKNCDSKQDKAFYDDGYVWCPINKLERIEYRGLVYNMEVEDDNSYTVNNVIVHNCQDISSAGKKVGLEKGTRSGLLWECEKIIREKKPKCLFMENVKNLVGKKFRVSFDEWCAELESMGYTNKWKVVNAKKDGIPQNRERIFMISFLGESNFEFAPDEPLVKKLRDILEDDVDESYYLSDKMLRGFVAHNEKHNGKSTGFTWTPRDLDDTAVCLRANAALCPTDNTIRVCDNIVGHSGTGGQKGYVHGASGIVGALSATDYKQPKQIYLGIGHHPTSKKQEFNGYHDKESPCLIATDCKAPKTVAFSESDKFRIRKLTPKECFRLMDVADEDFEAIRAALIRVFYNGKDKANSQLYKMAGNSIVVRCMEKVWRWREYL